MSQNQAILKSLVAFVAATQFTIGAAPEVALIAGGAGENLPMVTLAGSLGHQVLAAHVEIDQVMEFFAHVDID